MLTNMFVGNPPRNHDRILDFSTALTGSLFFAPAGSFLDDPPQAVAGPGAVRTAVEERAARPSAANDESLGIGGLRGTGP